MNLDYLKNKPIAVLGAGAMAKTMAADCKLGGMEVRMCELEQFAERNFFQVEQRGIKLYGDQLNLNGFERSGTAPVSYTHLDVYKRQVTLAGSNSFCQSDRRIRVDWVITAKIFYFVP